MSHEDISNQAEKLYTERKALATRRTELQTKICQKFNKLGRIRAYFAERAIAAADINPEIMNDEMVSRIVLGGRLYKADGNLSQMKTNAQQASATHYAENSEAYHALALEGAEAAGNLSALVGALLSPLQKPKWRLGVKLKRIALKV